jgi:transmembrane sensor
VVVTEVGHLDQLALPDGSIVRINTDSRVEVAYSAGERRVRLVRGEAYFTVAKDATRPFVVDAAGVAVRAVGTAFNVRLRPAGVDVLVTEGTVRVSDPVRATGLARPAPPVVAPGLPLLKAGERLIISVGEGSGEPVVPVAPVVVPAAEMARALAWQDQRIDVVAVPLAELVTEFNRYNSQKLVVADAALGERRFGGSFRVDAPETFARLLETRFGLRVERRGQVIVISP